MEPDQEPGAQQPVHAPMRRSATGGCWIVLPGILSTLGHLVFVSLLLSKWESLEDVNGGPLNFTSSFDGLPTDAAGPSWFSVFAPSWIAELIVVAMATCTVFSLPQTARNLRLLHVNSIAQSILCALFQVLFAFRLTVRRGSWFLVFSPWYMAMLVQVGLHYRKNADARGRRPGFPIGILHLLALVVSFKLEGAFNYASSSWANVLWPLWGVAGFFLLSLLLGLCCGLPCLMRRDAQVRCHLLCMFSALLLLLCSVVLPGLLALIRLTLWLDGKRSMAARDILVPYLIAVSIVLLLLCVSLAIVSFSSALRARGGLGAGDGAGDGSDEDGSMAELLSSMPAPTALVRESSTLFRRVSSATLDKYEQRHLSSGDRLLVQSSAGADDRSSNMSDSSGDGGVELGELRTPASLEAAAAAAAIRPPNAELAEIRVDLATPEPRAGAAGSSAIDALGAPASSDATAPVAAAAAAVADVTEAALTAAAGGGSGHSLADSSEGVRRDGKLVDDEGDEDGLGGELCWICCQGEREAVLLECGHGGICFSCALRCARKRPPLCPMCRSPIQQIVRIAGPATLVDGELVVPASAGNCAPASTGASATTNASGTAGGSSGSGVAAAPADAPGTDAAADRATGPGADEAGARLSDVMARRASDEVPLMR